MFHVPEITNELDFSFKRDNFFIQIRKVDVCINFKMVLSNQLSHLLFKLLNLRMDLLLGQDFTWLNVLAWFLLLETRLGLWNSLDFFLCCHDHNGLINLDLWSLVLDNLKRFVLRIARLELFLGDLIILIDVALIRSSSFGPNFDKKFVAPMLRGRYPLSKVR